MKKIIIKDYFQQEMENLRRTVVNPLSLLIVDATDGDVGNQIYIRKKVEDFQSLNWKVKVVQPKSATDLYETLQGFKWTGVIAQMPISKKFNIDVKRTIPKNKDVDGLTIDSLVMPATVRGIIDYLDRCDFEYSGKIAVVLGRSDIVGKPMARALLDRNMTVCQCHSKTDQATMEYFLKQADLVVSAVGHPHLFERQQCPYAYVIDVGINRIEGKLCGDFDECPELASKLGSWATPVPGGVGLLTRLGLIKNCVDLANLEGIYLSIADAE